MVKCLCHRPCGDDWIFASPKLPGPCVGIFFDHIANAGKMVGDWLFPKWKQPTPPTDAPAAISALFFIGKNHIGGVFDITEGLAVSLR